jgi:hypothetical protein
MDHQKFLTGIIAIFLGCIVLTGFMYGTIEPRKGYSAALPVSVSIITIAMGIRDVYQVMKKNRR